MSGNIYKGLQAYTIQLIMVLGFNFHTTYSLAQDKISQKTVIAGPQYKRSSFHQWLWGKHYRKEWIAPVVIPVMYLDTVDGGLKPYKAGGGRQSKTIRLKNPEGKEYVLRSIDKTFGKALPEMYQGTFIEKIINDQVSIAHPYSAPTIAPMAEQADIYHTIPRVVYIPKQPALDTFNTNFGNTLYLFEQRADENWEEAENFGNAKDIISTEKLFKKLFDDNDNLVDQRAYVRARLFDMLIGDWGRHEDQWRWAKFKQEDKTVYRPIPRDRDQAYTKFDGVLLKVGLSAAGISYLQSFDYTIKDPRTFSYPARNLDRHMANELTLTDWKEIATQLQEAITDKVIVDAIHQLPADVYPISGDEMIAKLESRRNHLVEYATKYYQFIATEVEIVGTKGSEYFEVLRMNDNETLVNIYNIDKEKKVESKPYYSRVFKTSETKEIRLYGISGKDEYHINGEAGKGIVVRIIGGKSKDKYIDSSYVAHGSHRTRIYDDNDENIIQASKETKVHLSDDTDIHTYKYNAFYYNKRGLKPSLYYNNPDRFYVRLGYAWKKYEWRKEPFGHEHGFYIAYSLSQSAFSLLYNSTFNQIAGKWNLKINIFQDAIRWANYYGLGNETKALSSNNLYYRMRTDELNANVGLDRKIGNHQTVSISTFVQSLEILNDKNRFVTDFQTPIENNPFGRHNFAGLQADYLYQNVNDPIVPEKGVAFAATASYVEDLSSASNSFAKLGGVARFYIPLFNKFSLASYLGATTVTGTPEFYQQPTIGGSMLLRGYRRDRFRGQTVFYNTNDLRWITNFRSYLFNGKIGVIALLDEGRVWVPNENSNLWHIGYGGGVLLAPFNKFNVSVTYGISDESKLVHIRFSKPL